MKLLVVIPARGGSKGVPGKNVKKLLGKPLIGYAIDVARAVVESDDDICVSSDDCKIIEVVEQYGLRVPFIRPVELATDTATTNDVLLHALEYYQKQGRCYDAVLLLQPTSPLRKIEQVREAIKCYTDDIDMVVSVKESGAASTMCRENDNGDLELCFNKACGPRQSLGKFYEYNGAIYVINSRSLMEKGMSAFTKRIKYVMPEIDSYDIDTPLDWLIVETILKSK